MKPTKEEVFNDLIQFFLDEFSNDPVGVQDWLIQGDWDSDEFISAVQRLAKGMEI